jgi:hypothetical protein
MINRELHEEFGHKWGHDFQPCPEVSPYTLRCSKCGKCIDDDLLNEFINQPCLADPDYVADPRLVLREMAGKLKRFVKYLYWYKSYEVEDVVDLIAIDDTGKLATLARDWLKGGRDGKV